MASKISIPVGMDAALEGLMRAVLKEQPDNIYVFAVDHFERLVRMRDTANLKSKYCSVGRGEVYNIDNPFHWRYILQMLYDFVYVISFPTNYFH